MSSAAVPRTAPYERLQAQQEKAMAGGGEKRIKVQHAKGKLTARERLQVLLDAGSFNEYDMFAEHTCANFGMQEHRFPCDAVFMCFSWGDGGGPPSGRGN